jgi:hypothetical protein
VFQLEGYAVHDVAGYELVACQVEGVTGVWPGAGSTYKADIFEKFLSHPYVFEILRFAQNDTQEKNGQHDKQKKHERGITRPPCPN